MKTLLFCVSVVLICSLLGCIAGINPYSQTYRQVGWAPPIKTLPSIVVREYTNNEDIQNQASTYLVETRRYSPDVKVLGFAYCYDTSDKRRSLIHQAKAAGADLVLLFRKPGAQIQKNFRLTLRDKPKTTIAETRGDGTIVTDSQSIYERDTTSRFDYRETTVIHHPQTYTTHNIPYTQQMYTHWAIFVKR